MALERLVSLRLGRVEPGLQVFEDPIDLDPALVHLDIALDARTQGLSCDAQIQVRLQIGKLSAHHAEMVRLRPNVHGPELTFFQEDAASDVQWIAAIVEQAHVIDAHLIASEHDVGVELVVRGLERIHREGAVLDRQLAIETRGSHAARNMHVPGECARDVANRRGQSLDEAQLDGAALQTYVERIGIARCRLAAQFGHGDRPSNAERCGLALTQLQVHVRAARLVIEGGIERLEPESPERAVLDRCLPFGARFVERAGKRRLGVQTPCEPTIGHGQVVQRCEIDVACLDADARGCGRARGALERDDAGGLDALIAVDECETVDRHLLAVVAKVCVAVGGHRPGHLAAVEGKLLHIDVLGALQQLRPRAGRHRARLIGRGRIEGRFARRIARLGDNLSYLLPAGFHEGRRRVGADLRPVDVQVRHARVVLAGDRHRRCRRSVAHMRA